MKALCVKYTLIQTVNYGFLVFVCLFILGIINNSLVVYAQETEKHAFAQQEDSSEDKFSDWYYIPEGSSGDWKTAVGRAESISVGQEGMERKEINPLLPQPQHLFKDWWGLHSWLYKRGINVSFDNQNEFAGNIAGGRKKLSTDPGAVDAALDIDWGTLAGKNWLTDGLVSHMTVIGRYGGNLSQGLGENITQVQEIYGAGGNVVAKLVNLYFDKHLFRDRVIVTFGRTNVGGSFATSPIHCYFINNGICGNPKPLSGQVGGFNAWPDSTWGINALITVLPQFYIRVGMYEVSRAAYGNKAGHRAGWASLVRTSQDAGAEFPLEMMYQPRWGRKELVGHYKVGFAYDTSSYPVWGKAVNGGHVTSANGADQRWSRGRDVEWVLLDQMIHRNGPGDLNGLIGYVGYVHSNPKTFQRQNEVMIGLINTGFWKARPMDAFGVIFIHQVMSRRARTAERYNVMQGIAMGNVVGGATGIQSSETTFELTYLIHVYRGVMFQPDFQYEIHPNAQKNFSNTAFLGFKSRVDF